MKPAPFTYLAPRSGTEALGALTDAAKPIRYTFDTSSADAARVAEAVEGALRLLGTLVHEMPLSPTRNWELIQTSRGDGQESGGGGATP